MINGRDISSGNELEVFPTFFMAFTLHNSAARSDKVGMCVGLGRL